MSYLQYLVLKNQTQDPKITLVMKNIGEWFVSVDILGKVL